MSDIDRLIREVKAGTAPPALLFPALARTSLYVPLADSSGTQSELSLWTFELSGKVHAALFTSAEEFDAFGRASRHVVLTGEALAQTWPEAIDAALNPSSVEVSLILSSDDMRHLSQVDQVPASQSLFIGAPAQSIPAYLPEIVADAVNAVDGVAEGYLFQLFDEAHGSRLVGGVVLRAGADPGVVMPLFLEQTQIRMPDGEEIEVIILGPELRETVRSYVEALTS